MWHFRWLPLERKIKSMESKKEERRTGKVKYGSHGPLFLQPRLNHTYTHTLTYIHTRLIHSSFSCPWGQCTHGSMQRLSSSNMTFIHIVD